MQFLKRITRSTSTGRGAMERQTSENGDTSTSISSLPNEVLVVIMGALDPNGLMLFSSTCRLFRLLAQNTSLWRVFFQKEGWCVDSLRSAFLLTAHSSTPLNSNQSSLEFTDYQVFEWKKKLVTNVSNGNYKLGESAALWETTKCMDVGRLNQEDGSYPIAVGATAYSAIWNLGSDGTLKRQHTNHSGRGTVYSAKIVGQELLLLGYQGGQTEFWNLSDNTLLSTFQYTSDGGVFGLDVDEGTRLGGYATYRAVRLFNVDTRELVTSIPYDDGAWVVAIRLHGDRFITGNWPSGDIYAHVRVWDVHSNTPIQQYKEHTKAVVQVGWDNQNLVASASSDETVKIWDLRQQKSVITLEHQEPVSTVYFDSRVLVSGSGYSIYTWDRRKAYSAQSRISLQRDSNNKIEKIEMEKTGRRAIVACSGNLHVLDYNV
jgi:WD40 repeat protein